MSRLDFLQAGLSQLDLPLSDSQQQQLLDYAKLIQKWNKVYNLTAITDDKAVLIQHLLDCLACIGPLKKQLSSQSSPRLLDVGSGAGLPGMVIAICEPAWKIDCVDTVLKKTIFIQQAAVNLTLKNLSSLHARVESLSAPLYDVITCRAFSSLADFLNLTQSSLKPGGAWCAMKGRLPSDELAHLPDFAELFHVEQLNVPELEAKRCLLWLRRKGTE